MEQAREAGNGSDTREGGSDGEPPVFTIRGGALWAARKDAEFCLGPAEAAHAAMVNHLAALDFEE